MPLRRQICSSNSAQHAARGVDREVLAELARAVRRGRCALEQERRQSEPQRDHDRARAHRQRAAVRRRRATTPTARPPSTRMRVDARAGEQLGAGLAARAGRRRRSSSAWRRSGSRSSTRPGRRTSGALRRSGWWREAERVAAARDHAADAAEVARLRAGATPEHRLDALEVAAPARRARARRGRARAATRASTRSGVR